MRPFSDMKTPNFPRRRRGFTLIELMVAMGITAIIVTVLVSITGVATDTWTRSRSAVRAARQAKVMLDTMAKDLESFVSRRGQSAEWLVAEIDDQANLPKVARDGNAPEVASMTFFTAATDRYFGQVGTADDKGGDVSCVSYRMRYQDPIQSGGSSDRTKTFVLYRLLVNPDETFQSLLGEEDLKNKFSGFVNEVTEEENFVCENVTQFTVTFLVEVTRSGGEGGGNTVETARVTLGSDNSGDEFSLSGTGIDTDISADGFSVDEIKGGRLTGVELSISVISDAGLVRINSGGGGGGLNEKDYARQVFHYSRTVELPGM